MGDLSLTLAAMDATLLFLKAMDDASQPLNTYKPGQSVHFTVQASVSGVLVNPTALAFTAHSADGTITAVAPVLDSVGNYHADFVIPSTAKPGVWVRRWQATGSGADQNAVDERRFIVAPLDF